MASLDNIYQIALNYHSYAIIPYYQKHQAHLTHSHIILSSTQHTLFLDYSLNIIAKHHIPNLKYLDSYDNQWHLFHSSTTLYLLSYTNHFQLKFNHTFNQIKILHIIQPSLFMFHCLILKQNQLYLAIISNLMEPDLCLIQTNVHQFYILNQYQVIIQTISDEIHQFDLKTNTIELIDSNNILIDARIVSNKTILVSKDFCKEITDENIKTILFQKEIQLISKDYIICLDENLLILYNYDYQKVKEMELPYQKNCQQIEFLQDNLIAIIENSQLFLIFQPDYLKYLQENEKNTKITQRQNNNQTVILKDKFDQMNFFQHIKKFRNLDLDSCIQYSLKKSDLKSLLLLCSRIRNYKAFYKQLLQKNFEIDKDLLKQCDCFDKKILKEEFVEEAIRVCKINPVEMEKYIKFMIENAEIIPEELFLELLNLPINSDNPPIVPNHNLIKQKAYKKCLDSSQIIFQFDYYKLKQNILWEQYLGQINIQQSKQGCTRQLQGKMLKMQEVDIGEYLQIHPLPAQLSLGLYILGMYNLLQIIFFNMINIISYIMDEFMQTQPSILESSPLMPPQQEKEKIIVLKRGGVLVYTQSLGYIQFGLPLGGIVELNELNIDPPTFYILTTMTFHKKQALNLAEFYAPALINYLNKKPFNLLCSKQQKPKIEQIIKLTHKPFNPFDLYKKIQFYDAMENNPKPYFEKEFSYILSLYNNQEQNLEDIIEFHEFNLSGACSLCDNKMLIKKKGTDFEVYEFNKLIATIQDNLNITYVEEVNWDQEIRQKYEGDTMLNSQLNINQSQRTIKSMRNFGKQNQIQKSDNGQLAIFDTLAPMFGVTFLGNKVTTGFIIWINGRGAMVDPPPYTTQILKKMQIPQTQVEWIILTQNNSENDAGAFQNIFDSSKIEIITTQPIIETFMQKYSILSGMPLDLIKKVIRFKPIVMGAPINLKGAIFKFFQTFSHIPSLGFEVYYENKGIYFAGDTLYDPDLLQKLSQKNIMTQIRAHGLSTIKWGFFNMIILYVGPYAWNTNINILKKLPEQYRKKMGLINREYLPQVNTDGFFSLENVDDPEHPYNTVIFANHFPKEYQYLKKCLKTFQQRISEIYYNPLRKNISNLKNTLQDRVPLDQNSISLCPGQLRSYQLKKMIDLNGIIVVAATLVNQHQWGSKEEQSQNNLFIYIYISVFTLTHAQLLSIESQDFWFIFGEEQDDAGPLIKKLFRLIEARKSKALTFIHQNKIFHEFNNSQQTQLEMILKETNIKPNQILWTVGEQAKFAFLLARGQFKFLDCPEEELSYFDQPGTFFGEINSIMTNDKLSTSIIALKESQIFLVEKNDLVDFFNQNPGLFMQFSNLKYFV